MYVYIYIHVIIYVYQRNIPIIPTVDCQMTSNPINISKQIGSTILNFTIDGW